MALWPDGRFDQTGVTRKVIILEDHNVTSSSSKKPFFCPFVWCIAALAVCKTSSLALYPVETIGGIWYYPA